MKPAHFAYHRAATLPEALAMLSEGDETAPVAGGQSLLVLLALRIAGFDRLVDVTRLQELRATRDTDDTVFLGAAVTHAEIEDGQVPDPSQGLMPRVAAGIGYRAIRNRGTLGGSLALSDPAADWPPCLMALDATLVIAGQSAERRLPVRDFHLGPYTTALEPGELILGAEIPRLPEGARWGCAKHARKSGAFADSIAVVVCPARDRARVVLGASESHPLHLAETSALLSRQPAAEESTLRATAAADIAKADPDADAWRRRCHLATVLKAIRKARR